MRAIVATASLELGIDVGSVDLVCQVGSPRAITTFLQRIGRAGHALGKTSIGRLFATSRDELLECAALIAAVREGTLDRIEPPVAPVDVLAQQIVAECACQQWCEDDLFELFRRAAPFSTLDRRRFDEVVEMLSEGPAPGMGVGRALLHRDRIHHTLRGRRAARLTALTSGGAIPDVSDYKVVLDPDETFLGTVNEDWAIESMAGDIFLLGSHSWRIRRVETSRGVLRVEDAAGQPPNVPFWLGEAPGRTWELSTAVSKLRSEVARRIGDGDHIDSWLADSCALSPSAASQAREYIAAEKAAIGVVPSMDDIVFERFFDESGGMQIVVHAPLGSRINRGLGLALRKRFCVNFDFELQAAATDDAIILSLGPQHSFPLQDAFSFVRSGNVEQTLRQAVLAVPLFATRWRWNVTRSLMLLRHSGGRKVPFPIQRMRSDDLMAAVFPAQVACQENTVGPIEIPDHPLVDQTMHDCLYEAIDLPRLKQVLQKMETGDIRLHARDSTEPSPFAHEILNAKPYAFLDDAPLEERRTQAVNLRRSLPEHQRDLGVLDISAIERVCEEARPQPRDEYELHDVLNELVASPLLEDWRQWFDLLVAGDRSATVTVHGQGMWFALENLSLVRALYPDAEITPPLPSSAQEASSTFDEAIESAVRGHVESLGPTDVAKLAEMLKVPRISVAIALAHLEGQGLVLRGRFRPDAAAEEWCDRRLLARIHRYTLDRLRSEIEPVSPQDFVRYLLARHGVATAAKREGKRGLVEVIAQLQGFEAPAVAWERDILPARVDGYQSRWLDELCLEGDVVWARLSLHENDDPGRRISATRTTAITLARREDLSWLIQAARGDARPSEPQMGTAFSVFQALRDEGALFAEDIVHITRCLPSHLEEALLELVSRGIVHADGFGALRQIMARRRRPSNGHRPLRGVLATGRWALLSSRRSALGSDELAEKLAWQILTRYGVVFYDLVARERMAIPWRDVVRALRRLEARGRIRGGRFVSGFVGEQYALPDAVESLRRMRRTERDGDLVHLNATDPLNLVGILTPGARVTSIHTNDVAYLDGAVIDPEDPRSRVRGVPRSRRRSPPEQQVVA
jgi:ATP-dependent helicase Lhr and Lhr-like helicase